FAPPAEGLVATDVVLVARTPWVRTTGGALAAVRGGVVDAERAAGAPGTSVRALARDVGGGVAALAADDAGRVSGLVRARGTDDGAVEHEALATPEAVGSRPVLAVRGAHVAYTGRRGGVVRRGPGGEWVVHRWEGHVTALAFVDDAGTLVAATYSEADDTTALVRLDAAARTGAGAPRAPRAEVVARLGPARAEPGVRGIAGEGDGEGDVAGDGEGARVLALAHDDARGVVWVAGGFGVAAFAVR
ncbi:MAG: hypothetical protein ABSE49_35960, partial [Polyangiaceae bacterium]